MGKQIYIPEIKAYLPDTLKIDLDIIIDDVVNSEMDGVIVIDGKEGAGKSYDGRLIGKYIGVKVNTPFTPKNIHFNTVDYIGFSENNKKFTINVLDESRQALNKRRGMSRSNVMFTNWLSENRDKQQFHIILLPAIHDLDSYIAVWRMKLLIRKLVGHVKDKSSRSGYKLVRGYFKVYENNKNLQQVIFNKAKYGYYSYPQEYKYQRKIKYCEVFTEEEIQEYKDKKTKARQKKYQEQETTLERKQSKMLNAVNEKLGISVNEMARLMDMPSSTLQNRLKKFRDTLPTKP